MTITTRIHSFESLSNLELYAILQLRNEVFIVEQNCPYLDLDDCDQQGMHISIYVDNQLAAYCRVFAPGYRYTNEACISRVITKPTFRKNGMGKQLMQQAISYIQEQWPNVPIKISAQLYLQKFYEDLGFSVISESYLEDNIPHVAMLR